MPTDEIYRKSDVYSEISKHVASQGPEYVPVPQGPSASAESQGPKSTSDRVDHSEPRPAPAGPARNGPRPS